MTSKRRMSTTSFFTLALTVRLNQTVSLVRYHPLRNPQIAAIAAQGFHAQDLVHPSRRSRRRARPAWSYGRARRREWWRKREREVSRSDNTTTAGFAEEFSNGGRRYPSHQEEQEHQTPGWSSSSVVLPLALTHKELPEESIYILDGTSMLFRAFYRRGSSGYLAANGATEVGAVLAMGIEFAHFINEVKPRYVAMAFDVARETTFRRDMFPAYKAQRKPIPPDLALQMPLARALCEALGCRTFAVPVFEADDVMATLARWARSVGLGVVVCSLDKDMCQLVGDRVHVMHPRSTGYAILGTEEVQAKFGVKPSSLPDLFGLVGDAADNIPGVRGIGPIGGSRLLERFGNLEGIFAGVEGIDSLEIRGSKALQELLSRPGVQEEAMLYREIATLHDEVPIDGVEDLRSSFFVYKGVSKEAEGVMKALGFTAPLRMIQEMASPAAGL